MKININLLWFFFISVCRWSTQSKSNFVFFSLSTDLHYFVIRFKKDFSIVLPYSLIVIYLVKVTMVTNCNRNLFYLDWKIMITVKWKKRDKKKIICIKHSPDWLPPAIWRISFVNPFEPNWHDRSCKVRGSPRSIKRSKKNSNVKFRAVSYSMVSMMQRISRVLFFFCNRRN